MKLRRAVLSLFALSLLATTPVILAQAEDAAPAPKEQKGKGPRGGAMMSAEEHLKNIEKNVGTLSEEQKTKILAIIKENREKTRALAPEERREKGRELMKAQNEAIRAVLTPEQQKKFDERPQGKPRGKKAA